MKDRTLRFFFKTYDIASHGLPSIYSNPGINSLHYDTSIINKALMKQTMHRYNSKAELRPHFKQNLWYISPENYPCFALY